MTPFLSSASNECFSFLNTENSAQNLIIKKQNSNINEDSPFEFANIWTSKKNINQESQHQINGVLIEFVSNYFVNFKKLPTENEIEADLSLRFGSNSQGFVLKILTLGLQSYFQTEGAPNSIFEILKTSIAARRTIFFNYKDELREDVIRFFSSRFRTPTLNELAQVKQIDSDTLLLFIPNPESLVKKALETNPTAIEKMKTILVSIYLRALSQKDIEDAHKTVRTTPSIESLFMALKATNVSPDLHKDISKGVFTLDHLKQLINKQFVTANSFFSIPLFESPKALENTARSLRPTAFKNFIPAEVYNAERTTALMKALSEKQGFLVTSVNAGIPLDEAMLATMLKFSKEKNYDIIIIPTAGILDGLDSRLLEHPNIHVLTHTVENKFLKLWNIPVLPKNQNALASLTNSKQHKPMQTVIVGHPAIQHMNVPTATNHIRATSIWSVGSLSQNKYPFRHAVQGRTSALAKNQHQWFFNFRKSRW